MVAGGELSDRKQRQGAQVQQVLQGRGRAGQAGQVWQDRAGRAGKGMGPGRAMSVSSACWQERSGWIGHKGEGFR